MREIEAVAFDIDGTLYPEWKFYCLIFPFILRHFSLMKAFGKVRREIRQNQLRNPDLLQDDFFSFQAKMLSTRLKKNEKEIKALVEEKIYLGWKKVFSKIKPYKHVVEVISNLKKRGLKIALLSDFPPEQKGDVWGVMKYCDVALSSENVGALKPSPFPFLFLSKELNVLPEKVLYVGNNMQYDVLGAKSVGMKTALINTYLFKSFKFQSKVPDIIFSDYRQLLENL